MYTHVCTCTLHLITYFLSKMSPEFFWKSSLSEILQNLYSRVIIVKSLSLSLSLSLSVSLSLPVFFLSVSLFLTFARSISVKNG